MQVTLNDARMIAMVIAKTCNPLVIIVFGSVAKNGAGNDLDLLIIPRGEGKEQQIYKCLKDFYKHFTLDPFIISLSTFKKHFTKGSPFLWMILKEGRYLYMKDFANEWFRQAEEELKTAKYLLNGGFLKGACYHSQQSIEKYIKGLLLKKGWELEKIHSIERLVAIGDEYRIKIKITDEDITFIDSIYRSRYPGEAGLLPLGEPTEADTRRAIEISEKIKAQIN